MGERIMLIGEDLKFCKKLKYELQGERLQCYYALDATDGLRHLIHYPYRLVLYETPTISAAALHQMERIHAIRPEVLLVVLCPNMEPQDYAAVLTTADSIISHLCDGQTYKNILEAVLHRSVRVEQDEKQFLISKDGSLFVDAGRRSIQVSSTELFLPRRQFDLLFYLVANEGMVFNRERIQQKVWGDDYDGSEHTLSSHMSSLRTKLKKLSSTKNYIRTEYGIGYSFDSFRG